MILKAANVPFGTMQPHVNVVQLNKMLQKVKLWLRRRYSRLTFTFGVAFSCLPSPTVGSNKQL